MVSDGRPWRGRGISVEDVGVSDGLSFLSGVVSPISMVEDRPLTLGSSYCFRKLFSYVEFSTVICSGGWPIHQSDEWHHGPSVGKEPMVLNSASDFALLRTSRGKS